MKGRLWALYYPPVSEPKFKISSVVVSVRSKRGLENYCSSENLTSFTFSKADGSPFTEREAIVAASEMSEKIRQKVLLDEVAQGFRSAVDCKDQMSKMEVSYKAIREKLGRSDE